MELRARILPSRRAATLAALGAVVASAAAGAVASEAQAAKRKPVVTSISPKSVAVKQVLTVRGKYFIRGRGKNTVVFKRAGAKAVFVKADVSTKRMLRVTIPDRLTPVMAIKDGSPIPTLFKIRVLAKRFGKSFTSERLSPFVGPELPPQPDKPAVDPEGDCDSDGQLNSTDVDDDNDLLLDATEKGLPFPTDPCKYDTDGDGIGDGYEYRSARDLNNDEYQNLNAFLPYPGKKPYPNPLDASDASTDFDGDSLTLSEEHKLWKYTLAHGAAAPTPAQLEAPAAALTYSDGMKYSVYALTHGDDRRSPALAAAGYDKELSFKAWLQASGYWNIFRPDLPESDPKYNGLLLDVNRDGVISDAPTAGQWRSESHYLDLDINGWLSDDERDEDGDGLTNFHESHGPMTPGWWGGYYPREKPFNIAFAGTDLADPDTDGDGVLDGADDQDHDDYPNLVEVSRNAVSGRQRDPKDLTPATANPNPWYGRVQPFNPCEPFVDSRSCPTHWVPGLYAPFDGPPWTGDGDDPDYLVRN